MKQNKPYTDNRIDYVVNLISPDKKQKVLNVGISNIPEIEVKIEGKVKECWTIDLDKEKIKKAEGFLKKTRLIYGDAVNHKFKKNYFDRVIILEVLEHLKEDSKAVKNINRSMKKGGELIVSVPNNNLLHFFNPVKYTQHERHYSNEMIKELLEKNGFEVNHFNVVESWRLLANLYVHLFQKYILRRNAKFGVFTSKGDKSYSKQNKNGLDIILKAVKVKDI